MAFVYRYSIYPSQIGAFSLVDLTDVNFRTASNKSSVIPGGGLTPQAIVNCCAEPMLTFNTKDFNTLFNGSPAVSLTAGYAVNTAAQSPTPSSLFQFQRRLDGSAFDTVGTHVVGTNTKGYLCVSEIAAEQDDVGGAKIAMEYHILSADGMTDPVSWSTTGTLTGSPSFAGIWYLGPVKYGAHNSSTVLMDGVQSVSIRPGINFRAPRADGDIYPHNGSIHSQVPEIRIRTLNPTALTNAFTTTMWGSDFSAHSLLFYFQKGVHGGGRVGTGVANHYLVTATTGDSTTDTMSVQQVDDVTTEIIIRPTGTITLTANTTIV